MHEETKRFEAYLLIQNRIQNECKNGIRETLLQKLATLYKVGGKEDNLMDVFRWIRN